jgi:hypothetical protein
MARAQPRADGPALDPIGRTAPTVHLSILREQSNVVASADLPGEHDVSVGQLQLPSLGLLLREAEQIVDPLSGDPDHRGGPSPTTARSHGI